MRIHILQTKGDYIYSDWIDGDVDKYYNKIEELQSKENKYVLMSITDDPLNEYTLLRHNETGETITITLQRC